MFVTNWISTTKIQKISEITNFFRHYFLSRTEVYSKTFRIIRTPTQELFNRDFCYVTCFAASNMYYGIWHEKRGCLLDIILSGGKRFMPIRNIGHIIIQQRYSFPNSSMQNAIRGYVMGILSLSIHKEKAQD